MSIGNLKLLPILFHTRQRIDFRHMAEIEETKTSEVDLLSVSVKNLTCYRNDFPVFSDVSFQLHPGEQLFIIGSNGSGKMTLLKTLMGLSSKFEGDIHIPPHETAYLGHLNGLKPELTVGDNHRFWLKLENLPISHNLLEYFEVDDLAETPVRLLSEGQKRKVALAGALETGKRIWVLDEPFNGLDQKGQDLLAELIQRHCEKMGIVVLTSNLEPISSPTQYLALDEYRSLKPVN